ncbi:MAG: GGDEF domain-containing protein [Oscillospiraceae bacterium]|jgi:diguanylate cyclase (GGDEF)-like protein|nr:GGDEF domain-containing protein [Oscillospiraceae bacterium]
MKKGIANLFDRIQSLETWEYMWQVVRYLFVFIFTFSIITGFLVYFAVSLGMGFAPFANWGELNDFHIKFAISLGIGLLIFSALLTVMFLEIYQRVIYHPVKKLLGDLEKNAKQKELSGKNYAYFGSNARNIFSTQPLDESWTDKVRNVMQEATRDIYVDDLTGCLNRKYMSGVLPEMLNTHMMCSLTEKNLPKTNATVCIALYLIDIDFFKTINDDYGHLCGDEVLKKVGETLFSCVGANGLVIRSGGEEFLLVVSHHFPVDYAHYAESLRKRFAESVKVPADATHAERSVTCSIGFTPFPLFEGTQTPLSLQEHVDMADQAMYLSKGGGRNTWRGIEPIREPEGPKQLEMALSSIEYGVNMGYYQVIKPEEKTLFDGVCRPGNYFVRRNG